MPQDKYQVISGLIEEIEILQAYEEDYVDNIQDFINLQVVISIGKNIEANKMILGLLKNLENGESINNALKKILFLRYSFIKSRHSNTLRYNEALSSCSLETPEILYGPTNPDIYDSLTARQQFLATYATEKYRTYNRVIIGIASLVDLRNLSSETKKLLRASPLLCSLLENKSKDLGHPDETFILRDKAHERKRSDWEYFTAHLWPSEEIKIVNYSSFYKEEVTLKVSPYERKLVEPKWSHPYASTELPYPAFLKPYPLTPIDKLERANQLIPPNNVFEEETPQDTQSIILIAEALIPIESIKGAEKSLVETTTIVTPTNTSLELGKKIFLPNQNAASIPLDISEESTLSEELKEVPRPRGMRLFHKNSPQTQHQPFELKRKHLKIYQGLFDTQGFSSIKYSDFAALWRHINGDDSIQESKGGSHKVLLDSDRNKITGIFAHGNNQTFGKRSIIYIRDAFNQIGYGEPLSR